jgi:GNAT superfamily N-acetyltransferase
VEIRRARDDDAAAIAAVHVRSWQETYRGLLPQDYLDALDPARRVPLWERTLAATDWPRAGTHIAELNGAVVGFANVCPTRDADGDPVATGELASIYLHPTVWGKGFGRELMIASLQTLSEAGFARATLWVLDNNSRAVGFYGKGGWRADGATKSERLGDVLLNELRYRRLLRNHEPMA